MIGSAFDLVRLAIGIVLLGVVAVVMLLGFLLMLVVWPVFVLALFL